MNIRFDDHSNERARRAKSLTESTALLKDKRSEREPFIQRYFKNESSVIDDAFAVLGALRPEMAETVPQSVFNSSVPKLETLVRTLSEVFYFDAIQHERPQDALRELREKLRAEVEKAGEALTPMLSWHREFDQQVEEANEALRRFLADAKSELSESAESARKTKAEFADALEAARAIRPDIQESLAVKYHEYFEKEANSFRRRGRWWLFAAYSLSAIGMLVAYLLWKSFDPELKSIPQVIHYATTKIIILSVIFFVLSFAVKQYGVSRHNEILNLHRSAAMQTFALFVGSPFSDVTKDAVLLQATSAIFSIQRTGVLSKEPPVIPSGVVTDAMKSIISGDRK